MWSDVTTAWHQFMAQGHSNFPALQHAIDQVFDDRVGDVSGRGRLGADMREIWQMQPRFEKRNGSGPWGLVEQPRFRAGFDFMRLRADVGEIDETLADWWQEFSLADDSVRHDLMDQVRNQQQRPKVRRVPRGDGVLPAAHTPSGAHADPAQARTESTSDRPATSDGQPADSAAPAMGDAPAKRRRRRRRPGSSSGAADGNGGGADHGAGPNGQG